MKRHTAGTKMSEHAGVAAELQTLIRAKYPVIAITTKEERRAERAIASVAETLIGKYRDDVTGDVQDLEAFQVIFWSCTQGFTHIDESPVEGGNVKEFSAALAWARGYEHGRAIFVLRDPHHYLTDPNPQRSLRDTARFFKRQKPPKARAVILLSPTLVIPKELEGDVYSLEWPLPNREDLAAILADTIRNAPTPEIAANLKQVDQERIINAVIGLPAEDAYGAFARSIVGRKTLDAHVIAAEKRQLFASSGCLEWMEPDPRGLAAVGGLDIAKVFLAGERRAFEPRARDRAVRMPKGVFLFGAQGCGKTLLARALAGEWGVQPIRMNVSALYGPHLGETERAFRDVRKVFKVAGRLVVLIDEIEKAVGGDGTEITGGTAGRLRGEFLTWLQDRDGAEIYLVASANNIIGLADSCPEMIRKGRWDEMFFVPLPYPCDRAEILRVHIEARRFQGATPPIFADIDVMKLVGLSNGFSGAELESVIEEGVKAAFMDGERSVTTEDLEHVMRRLKPLSITAGDALRRMATWADGRAVWASTRHMEVD